MMRLIHDLKRISSIIVMMCFLVPLIHAGSPGSIYAEIDRTENDSIYVAIHNTSSDTLCLFTGFIHSSAARTPWCNTDQLLYVHRYDPDTDVYKVSFVPLKPFMQYQRHVPVNRIGYPEEPSWPLTYEFSLILPHEKFIYPVSISSISRKDYIYDYHPENFPFYNILAKEKGDQTYLAKYPEYKP